MKEIKFVKKEVLQPELFAITCNCCSKRHESRTCYDEELANFHNFEVEGGYGSDYPQDMDRLSFTLCSDCLKSIVSTFKVEPTIEDSQTGSDN
jgi:hypothetical protein